MKRANSHYVSMLVLLTAAALLSLAVRHGRVVPLRRGLDQFPLTIGQWKGHDLGKFPDEIMKVLQATDYLSRDYRLPSGEQVNLYIGYYAQQRAGESMHSPKNCLPGGGWEVLDSRRVMMDIPAAHKSIEVNHYVVENENAKQFVLYWYDTHGRAFASEYEGKAILVWEALKTGRTDGALIRVLIPFGNNQAAVEKTAHSFAVEMYPLLKEYLPE